LKDLTLASYAVKCKDSRKYLTKIDSQLNYTGGQNDERGMNIDATTSKFHQAVS
jgi:hypothetical protein